MLTKAPTKTLARVNNNTFYLLPPLPLGERGGKYKERKNYLMTKFQPGGPPRFRHQRRGLRKLIDVGGRGALVFDPGTGKTAVALDYATLLALKSETGEARVLVVAPLAAVDTWVQQCRIFVSPQIHWWAEALGGSISERNEVMQARGPQSKTPRGYRAKYALAWDSSDQIDPGDGPDVLPFPRLVLEVLNIDALSSRLERGSKTMADLVLRAVRRFSPDLLILDESHRAKSPSSNNSRLLYRISKYVDRRILLTGTVMPHSPLDVFAQWRIIDPTTFGRSRPDGSRQEATWAHFEESFAVMGGHMNKEVVAYQNLDRLQKLMGERALAASKDDVLDLPATTDTIVSVTLAGREASSYADMKKNLATQLSDGTLSLVPNRLAQMMRLRQITSGFIHDSDTGVTEDLGSAKADMIRSLVYDNLVGEQRIVVFCQFRHEIAQLAELLSSRKYEPATEVLTITGSTAPEDRVLIRKRFGSSENSRLVLLAQTRTMSLAINELVSANHAIFGSLSWQRDDLVQARDRLHRIGQTRPVTFWWVLARKSVDEVIYQSYLDRTNLEADVLAHIKQKATP